MITKCEDIDIKIYIAGDVDKARDVCRSFCYREGFCVTVTATEYIYTEGSEIGVVVGIINYPRFPVSKVELLDKTSRLAVELREELCQKSFTITDGEKSHWDSIRED
jgi:hypothetical protein